MAEFGDADGQAPLRIGVAGLGNVGATLVRILQKDGAELTRKLGRQLQVVAVAARSRSRDRGIDISGLEWFDDPVALAKWDGIDLFVELIGGEDGPAFAAVKAALEIGRPVVTANKALLAKHGVTLAKMAEEAGAQLGFEAAVAGGIPVIKTLREGLGSARIAKVFGIMNGTCNYILTRMGNEGISFADCLKDAQALGYAEADPTFDVEGFDTAHKLSILATLCFGYEIAPDRMRIEGISRITQHDIQVAADLGYKIKLLGIAERTENGIEQRVHPTFVPKGSAIAGVDGVMNAVALETDHVHELLLAGPGAGGPPTASSVLSDILDIARGTRVPPLGVPSAELMPYHEAPMRAHPGGFYIRLSAKDVPGALAAIATRMGEKSISIDSVIQRSDLSAKAVAVDGSPTRTVVMITQQTLESSVREALAEIAADGFIVGEPQLIRIEKL
ncbi:homoserine dehydrogenase [Devosia sp. 63-57]|uniref:homoserine dehydrogenase n=1 Tax=Devosia sp. 63-57 TaxID=1895751 RepID=UPI000868A3A6|nr:homoserine dehydrogenase [Devosia sp. 63-57]ODT49174.1 MAG: homoserine dehydrogenase [Pelagibacterium sp. SCN 63-126]ODU86081.1 MAG: homoserine dehydrogenase [Pelagibacterium sp. SCN 63-17]OJX43738.1 MAG: homoserine dehydrogenase [Devosia sp. 63-57]